MWRRLLPVIAVFSPVRSLEFTGQEDRELSPEIRSAIASLSAEERNLLVLRALEDKTFEEIAQILNKSAPSVRKKFERLKRKLQKKSLRQGGEQNETFSTI